MSVKLASDCVAERESGRFERRVGPGKHRHHAVVRPEDFGSLTYHSKGAAAVTSMLPGASGDKRTVFPSASLMGVGVGSQIEERGVKAGLGLRSGLHTEVA